MTYLILILYVVYVIVKVALLYWANQKLKERENEEKQKVRRRKIRVREVRPDRTNFPF